VIPKQLTTGVWHDRHRVHISQTLIDSAAADSVSVYQRLETRPEGLTDEEAAKRLDVHGPNVLAKDTQAGVFTLIGHAVLNPLVILLAILASVSFVTGDVRAGTMMAVMIALGAGLKLVQEARADNAAAQLKAMISVGATVIRGGQARDIPISQLVPGDIVALAAGDMIPADVRVLTAKDLFVNQSTLTGESFPVEKFEDEKNPTARTPVEFTSVAFLGTSVESGSGTAVVVATPVAPVDGVCPVTVGGVVSGAPPLFVKTTSTQ
jgi:Mg2+-importing ATPase